MKNEENNTDNKVLDVEKINNDHNINKWCFTFSQGHQTTIGWDRAAMLNKTKWNIGETITIVFLDGEKDLQEKVKKVALQWVASGRANLRFHFLEDGKKADIRISFQYAGSWSVLGKTCREIDPTKPTMNFGWLNSGSSEDELKRVVLHEFGHALGLIHEHMNPIGGIKWNRKQVIKDLSGPPNSWSKDIIENNMFKIFKLDEVNATNTDSKSIMMYPIPKKWTKNGFSVGFNNELSCTDIEFIRQAYPGSNAIQ